MIYEITVPQFTKMLQNLSRILDKATHFAETKKIDVEVLLNSRLAPDQFNLIRQIQIACDTAKLATARLTGKQAPVHEDLEKTLPELKTRIDEVVKYLGTFSAGEFAEANDRRISQPRWEGKYLTGLEYAIQHAIPNVYFHVTTAYDILRHNGVDVGKKDYLGEMPFKN
ncbi:DUF1993 domain-containing protein [Leptospira broomii]|nr:DUF1993 domain-containing protein [Leptospira broomii]